MVKIKDLTEKQLLSQIEKYEKIYTQLLAERDKRVKSGADMESLKTAAEKKADQIRKEKGKEKEQEQEQKKKLNSRPLSSEEPSASDESDSTSAYHLKIDESELSNITANNEATDAQEEEEEEVRVTQLLQLSKAQLEELRGGAEKEKKKEKKSFFGKKKKDKK